MKTPCLKKHCCQVGHRAVKCPERGEVSRNSNLRAPLSHDKMIDIPQVELWTSCAKIASRIQSLNKTLCTLIDGPVSLWFMGYDHWRLQNELSQTKQHPCSVKQGCKIQKLNCSVKKKILSSKNLSDFQHFWQLPYSMHTKETKMNAIKESKIFLWH